MKALITTLIPLCLALASRVAAEPSGGVVTGGSATIAREGLKTTIHQTSGRAIINWQGFDIGSNEGVQFLQPGGSSIALNRIVGGGATQINGALLANGRIFLINTRGIVFGSSAQVDVGALLATTSNISNSNFMSGNFDFGAAAGGSVVNYGRISVDSNGFVFLVAPTVANHGSIIASAGTVGLHSSGEAFTLDFSGDGLIRYVVSREVEEELSEDSEGEGAEGTVLVPQDTGFDVVTSVVNNEAITEASALVERDGAMVLQGDPGTLWNSGTIDVSATDPNTDGGRIMMSGDFVGTEGVINAQGNGTGGGGLVTLESARHTLVTSDARLDVRGGEQGSAGSVLILSDTRSTFNGQIDARGGALQGDGGFVDVSSFGEVQIDGMVDASAPYGEMGMFLIDPKNIDVNNAGGALYNSGVNNEFNNNDAGDTIISATSINTQAADVLLQANTDITITDAIDLSANPGVGIALQAGRSVLVNNSITTDGGDVAITANDPNAVLAQRDAGAANITMASGTAITAGAGSIDLTVDSTGHGDAGDVTAQALSSSGGITVDSAGSVALQGTVTAGAVTVNSDNDVTTSDTVNATTLNIDAGRAVALNADITTTGTVTITANSSAADAAQHLGGTGGIDMAAGTTLDAGSANIQMTVDAAGHGDAGGVTVDEVTTTGNLTIDSYGAISEADADDEVDVRGDILTLNTQDPSGAMIGAPGTLSTDPLEIEVGLRLDMTTQGGYVAVHRPDHTFLDWRPVDDIFTPTIDESQIVDFGLGTVNLGAANLILTVTDGSILDANTGAGAANITAIGATLNTNGGEDVINSGTVIGNDGVRGGSIGDAVNPLRTDVDILSAISTDDSIFIQEADEIILSRVEAKQEGVSAKIGGSGVAVRNLRGVNLIGENSVTVTAGGTVGVDVMTATETVSVISGGTITDTNAQLANITAPSVELSGTDGIGQEPIDEGLALDTATEELTAVSSAGGVFVANNLPGTTDISQVTANGGNNIYLLNTQGILQLGEVTANGGGNVEVNSGGGSIIDGNGATVNITGEDVLVISSFDVGSDLDAIETTATNLEVQMVEEDASFFVDETDGLDSISAQVNNGDTNLTFSGGTFDFDSNTGVFTSSGAVDIRLENTGGDVGVGTVSAANSVEIRSSDAITDAASLLTTDSVTLAAETGIGAAGSEIQTDVTTLDAQTRNGGVYIRENDDVSVTAVAAGTGGVVDLATGNAGDLSVVRIQGKDEVTLNAAGSIVSTSQTGPVRGATASLTAGGAIGSATDPLATRVSSLTAEANGGGLFVENTGDLTLDTATATGDSLSLSTTGTLALGTVTATGQSVVLYSGGAMTDNNAAGVNVTSDSLSISSGGSIGGPGANEAVDIDVSTLNVPKTFGAVYLNSIGTGILALVSAEATGSNADFELNAAGDIDLGSVIAAGDKVSIISTGAIFDANGTDLNVTADSLTIEAPGGIAVGDALETKVNQLSSTGNAVISNSGPLALTEASLEGGSSSFIADDITILDIADDLASLQPNVSLSLVTPSGHIVFLDTADTIQASGTGTITIDAGSTTPGSGAVAILGNLVTEDQNITVSADLHITMGLFDAGTGDVSVQSNNGVILDGNGSDVNIIGNNVTLRASQPTDREQLLHTINSIADAHAEESEEHALGTLLQANDASAAVLAQALLTQIMLRDAKEAELDEITIRVDELTARVAPIATAIEVMEQTIQAMTIAADVLNVAGSIAQAIPQTGDGGLLATAAAFETGIGVVDKALFYTQLAYDILAEDLADLEATQAELAAQLYTHEQVTDAMAESSSAANEALSIAQAGYDAAVIASDQAWQVSDQAVLAEDVDNALGTMNQDFGIQASGDIDATVDNSSIYLELEGGGTLNNVNATNPATDALISVKSNGDIGVKGAVTGESLVRLETSAGAVINDGGTVTASEFLALTTDGVGVDGLANGGLASSVDTFAARGGSGEIMLINDKALVIGTVDGVNGLTADGLISVTADSSALTVSQDVDSQADVNLVAGDDTASTEEDLTVETGVTVSGTGTITLTSGDNTELASGSTIEGGEVYIIADHDGNTDGEIGGVVADGAITGSLVDIEGGDLEQGGNITSTGIVDIDMTGTVTQDGDIQGTTITVDGTDIVQNGNTTGTSVDLNGSSLKQVGNIVSTGIVDIDMTGNVTQDGDIQGTTITVDGTDIVQNGNTTGTSVDLNGDSLKQVGNIVSTGFVDIDMTGNVTQDGNIQGTTITVDGADIVQTGNTDGSSVTVTGDSLDQSGNIVSTGAVIIDTTDEVIQSGNVTATSVDIDADGFDHSGTITSTGPVDITTVSTGSSVVDGIKLADIQAAGQTVTLSATGTPTASITDNNGADRNILAANLAMTATAGVGTAADSLETEVGRMAADGGTGGVFTDNTGNLLLDTVSGVSAVTASGGAIDLSTTGDIEIANGFVQGAGLQVDLTATGGSILEVSPGPDADVVGDTINLTVTGVTNTIGTSTERLEIDGNVLNAMTDGGSIFVEDTAGGLAVGEVSTTDFAQNSVVDLLITGGSLLESGSDPDADILGETIKINVVDAGATIGASAADRIEIDAAFLDVTTNEGDVFLEDTAGGVAITSVDTGALGGAASTLDLKAAAGGSITDAADDDAGTPGIDLRAEHILLSVTGGSGNVGADVDHRLEIDADLLDVTTEEGNVFLDDRTGGVTLGAVDTGVLGSGDSTIDLITHAGGSITDAADDDVGTPGIDLRAENLILTVAGGTGTVGEGTGKRLEIDADVLDVTTEEGSVFLDDRTGGVALGLIETGAPGGADSTVDLIAHDGGSILDAADDDATTRDIDIRAEQITLAVTGGNGSIGLNNTRRVEIDAEVLDVTTQEGSVFLDDRVGGVALGRIETGPLGGGSSTVDLVSSSGASITDQSSGDSGPSGNDVRAEHILLSVTGGPGSIGLPGEPLELDANLLDVITQGGNLYLEETSGGAAIGQLSTGGGPGTVINIVASGTLFANNPNDGIADLVAEILNLQTTGSSASLGGAGRPIEIDTDCLNAQTGGGSIYLRDLSGGIQIDLVSTTGASGSVIDLQALGGSIVEKGTDAAADLVSDLLFLDVTGSGSTIGTSSNTLSILVNTIEQATTDGGNIYLLDQDGGVAVGRMSTGSGGRIELTAVNGPITDTGGDSPDITTGSVLLRSTGSGNGIGRSGDPLDLDVTNLSGFTSGGSIYLTDLSNNVYVDQLSTGGSPGSTISLEARSGSILEAEPRDPGVDVRAGNIIFTVHGEGNSVGTIENPLEISTSLVSTLGGGRTFVLTPDGEPLVVISDTDTTGLILVNGKVVGGGDIRIFTQARATLRPYELIRTVLPSMPEFPLDGEMILAPEEEMME